MADLSIYRNWQMPDIGAFYQARDAAQQRRMLADELQRKRMEEAEEKARQNKLLDIMQQGYTPETTQVNFEAEMPNALLDTLQQESGVQRPANLVQRPEFMQEQQFSGVLKNQPAYTAQTSPTDVIPFVNRTEKTTPESFDFDKTIKRLLGGGFNEEALKLMEAQQEAVTGSADSLHGSPDTIYNPEDKKYYKLSMTKSGELIYQPINGLPLQAYINPFNIGGTTIVGATKGEGIKGDGVKRITNTLSPDAAIKEDIGHQVKKASEVTKAEEEAKSEEKRRSGAQNTLAQSQSVLQKVDGIKRIINQEGGVFWGTAGDVGTKVFSKATGIGNKKTLANTEELGVYTEGLVLGSKPPGMGAMSDSEWERLERAMGNPSSMTREGYMAAIKAVEAIAKGDYEQALHIYRTGVAPKIGKIDAAGGKAENIPPTKRTKTEFLKRIGKTEPEFREWVFQMKKGTTEQKAKAAQWETQFNKLER